MRVGVAVGVPVRVVGHGHRHEDIPLTRKRKPPPEIGPQIKVCTSCRAVIEPPTVCARHLGFLFCYDCALATTPVPPK